MDQSGPASSFEAGGLSSSLESQDINILADGSPNRLHKAVNADCRCGSMECRERAAFVKNPAGRENISSHPLDYDIEIEKEQTRNSLLTGRASSSTLTSEVLKAFRVILVSFTGKRDMGGLEETRIQIQIHLTCSFVYRLLWVHVKSKLGCTSVLGCYCLDCF